VGRVEVSTIGGTVPPIAEAFKRLDAIKELPFNWDSYGSAPPSNTAVDAAHNLIWKAYLASLHDSGEKPAVPYVVLPLSGGGVQVEWRGVAGAIEVEISSEGVFGYLLARGTAPSREFEEMDNVPEFRILALIRSVIS
jgi:hypothetical protein